MKIKEKITKTCSIITFLMIFTCIVSASSFAQGASLEYVVRAIHFVPADLEHDPNVEIAFDRWLKVAQQFYADEMERHGFGRKTFRLETDGGGKVVFHRVKGRFGSAHYATDPLDRFKIDTPQMLGFDTSKNIYVNIAGFIPAVGAISGFGSTGIRAVVGVNYNNKDTCQLAARDWHVHTVLHELGHAFGLPHDWRTGTLMSYGVTDVPNQLSKCAAEWLDGHRYFNRNPIDINTTPTTIEMLPPLAHPPNAIRLRFQITDADGLHQAQLIGPTDYSEGTGPALLNCRLLSEKRNTTVEFITTQLALGPGSSVSLSVIDKHGNFTAKNFSIRENDIRVDHQNRIDINGDGVTNAADRIPAVLRKVSGDNQHGNPNIWFPKPLVVEVLDTNRKPVIGVKVEFRVRVTISDRVSFSHGGYENQQFGILSDPTPRTDANGQAKSFLMLGDDKVLPPELFKYRVTVSVPGISKQVSFDTFDWSVKVLIPPEDGDEMYWIANEALVFSGSRWEFSTNKMVSYNAIDVVSDGFGRLFYLTRSDGWGNKEGLCATITLINKSLRSWRKVITEPTRPALGIAVDPLKGKVYWTNTQGNIQTCNLDGSNIQNLMTGLNAPKHITVDTLGDKLYWTDGRERIQRADLNGKNIQTFARSPGTLGDITIAGDHLYWTEKIDETFGNIRRANIKTKSKNIRTIVRDADAPVGVDIAYDKLYWTDIAGRIRRASLDGSHIEDVAIRLAAPGPLAIVQQAASSRPPGVDGEPAEQKVVSIPDPNLAKAVRKALGLGNNAPITRQHMLKLSVLDAKNSKIKNLTGLEHAKQLTRLNLDRNQIRNLTPLSGLTRLKTLTLDENEISNVRPLTKLTQLDWLLIGGNPIKNAGVQLLADLKQLRGLSLYRTEMSNVKPLANLTKLESLWLDYNQIRDVSPLGTLTNLRTLHLRENQIRDVSPLTKLTELTSLRLAENPIKDVGPLASLRNLEDVDIEIPAAAPTLVMSVPEKTDLHPNYPNPFNPETWIPYQLSKPTEVTLTIYAIDGQVVRQLALGHQPAGIYQNRSRAAHWDGRNALGEAVASGVYFYSLTAGEFTATRKMLIMK